MERAPKEVAKHFHEKYGYTRAMEIISGRLSKLAHKQDTVFWNDVMKTLDQLASTRLTPHALPPAAESGETVIYTCQPVPRG